jgi:outer membrane protein assembly factor BamA
VARRPLIIEVRQEVWLGALALIAMSAPVLAQPSQGAQAEVIAAIQVQGNTLTPDDEVVRASGLSPGAAFSDSVLREAAERLQATRRFQHVDVLKRYDSIADPTQILILIRVDEGPVRVVPGRLPGQAPRVARRHPFNVMYAPILDAEDGYGWTYGVQVAVTGNANTASRVIFPLSWGGNKRAGAEFQQDFSKRWAPRLSTGAVVQRRRHPFFRSNADRRRVWGRGEWVLLKSMRAGATVAFERAALLDRRDTTHSIGGDLVLDTRTDQFLPRNAIYARAALDRRRFTSFSLIQTNLEVNGYLGVYLGSVLVLRALREDASRALPPSFKSILGGADNLRGFRAGTAVGDTLAAGSVEWRIPLNSPLNVAKVGTSVFIDVGTTYDKGQHLRDQHLKRGVGAGVWATAALFRISLMVAHGIGADTRVHLGAGLTF